MSPTEADYGNNVSGATGDAGPPSSLFLGSAFKRLAFSLRHFSLIVLLLSVPLFSRLSLCIRPSNGHPALPPSSTLLLLISRAYPKVLSRRSAAGVHTARIRR